MQNAVWIDLIRRLPLELHSQLVLVTDARAEIAVEVIFRLEADFAVIRGRLAGTTDAGNLFLVPYGKLTAVMLARELKESDIDRLFPRDASEKETAHGRATPKARESAHDIDVTPLKPQVADSESTPANKSGIQQGAPTESSIAARHSLLDKLKAARHVSTGR